MNDPIILNPGESLTIDLVDPIDGFPGAEARGEATIERLPDGSVRFTVSDFSRIATREEGR